MLKLDKDQFEYFVSSWVYERFRTIIHITYWMTDRKVCDSCSSASITFNQALISPGYDRGPLPSSSCWYSPLTPVTWLIEPEIELYIPTSLSTKPNFNPILLALFINNTWFHLMCTSSVPSHQIHENVSTLTSNTARQLVPHLDAFLLECKWENHFPSSSLLVHQNSRKILKIRTKFAENLRKLRIFLIM